MMPSAAWKQDGGGYIEERQKARGPEGLFAFRATGRGRIRCNFKRLGTYHNQRKTNLRMQHVNQEVLPIDIVDVAIVGIGPAHRPRIDKLEPGFGRASGRRIRKGDQLPSKQIAPGTASGVEGITLESMPTVRASIPRDGRQPHNPRL